MNIVVKLDQPSAGSDLSGRRFDLEAVLKKQQQDRVAAAAAATTKTTTTTTTPSDDHFLFFKEVSAPPRSSFFLFTRAIFCFHPLTELPPFRCGLFGRIGNVHPEPRVVCCLFILSFSKMSAAGFVDVQLEDIQEILELHPRPILILSGRHFECRIIFPGCSTFLDMFVTERIRTW